MLSIYSGNKKIHKQAIIQAPSQTQGHMAVPGAGPCPWRRRVTTLCLVYSIAVIPISMSEYIVWAESPTFVPQNSRRERIKYIPDAWHTQAEVADNA